MGFEEDIYELGSEDVNQIVDEVILEMGKREGVKKIEPTNDIEKLVREIVNLKMLVMRERETMQEYLNRHRMARSLWVVVGCCLSLGVEWLIRH